MKFKCIPYTMGTSFRLVRKMLVQFHYKFLNKLYAKKACDLTLITSQKMYELINKYSYYVSCHIIFNQLQFTEWNDIRAHLKNHRLKIADRNDDQYIIWHFTEEYLEKLSPLTQKSLRSLLNKFIDSQAKILVRCPVKFENDTHKVLSSNENKENAVVKSSIAGVYGASLGLMIAEDAALIVAVASPVGLIALAAGGAALATWKFLNWEPKVITEAKSWLNIDDDELKNMNSPKLLNKIKKRIKLFYQYVDHPDKGGTDDDFIQTQQNFHVLLTYINPELKTGQQLKDHLQSLTL